MNIFEFIRPADQTAAIVAAAQSKTAQQGADVRFLGGGTTLIDLMKLNVETPSRVLDINRLPLDKIEATSDGGLKIGAMARNSDLAYHPKVQKDYSVLSQAILQGASAQIRNMARLAATCCSGRVASTSATQRWPATSVSPAAAAQPLGNTGADGAPQVQPARQAINAFIRTAGIFDSIADFDTATVDPATGSLRARYLATGIIPKLKTHRNRLRRRC
jgi:hypothetical protein